MYFLCTYYEALTLLRFQMPWCSLPSPELYNLDNNYGDLNTCIFIYLFRCFMLDCFTLVTIKAHGPLATKEFAISIILQLMNNTSIIFKIEVVILIVLIDIDFIYWFSVRVSSAPFLESFTSIVSENSVGDFLTQIREGKYSY